jgi:hypothetical protein
MMVAHANIARNAAAAGQQHQQQQGSCPTIQCWISDVRQLCQLSVHVSRCHPFGVGWDAQQLASY